MTLAIIGAGSWGTALAIVLAPKFERVRLWAHEQDLAARMIATGENDIYLKGFRLPPNVDVLTDLGDAVGGAGIVMGVMPAHHARGLYARIRPHLDHSPIFVSATKGIETGTLLRMSEVIADVTEASKIAALSGPTFAREVASGEPAAVVIAASNRQVATEVQAAFSGPTLRLYTNHDPIGVEVGAALKNVIAIGAGLGDLVLTCSGELSRNRQVGLELARGRSIADITGSMSMVAEGVETCVAAVELGARFGVDLPIIQQMHAVMHRGKSPREALRDLMERTLKGE